MQSEEISKMTTEPKSKKKWRKRSNPNKQIQTPHSDPPEDSLIKSSTTADLSAPLVSILDIERMCISAPISSADKNDSIDQPQLLNNRLVDESTRSNISSKKRNVKVRQERVSSAGAGVDTRQSKPPHPQQQALTRKPQHISRASPADSSVSSSLLESVKQGTESTGLSITPRSKADQKQLRNQSKADIKPNRNTYQDEKKDSGRKGGLLRIAVGSKPPDKPLTIPSVSEIAPRGVPRPGVDIPPSRKPRSAVAEEDTASGGAYDVASTSLRALELSVQRLLESARDDPSVMRTHLQGIYFSSTATGSSMLELEERYIQLMQLDADRAARDKTMSRLWAVRQRRFECVARALSSDRVESIIGLTLEQLRTVMAKEIESARLMLARLSSMMTESKDEHHVDSNRVLYIARGDLCKHRLLHLADKTEAKAISLDCFFAYSQARRICPSNGSSYKSLASLFKLNDNTFMAIYFTLRGMCVSSPLDGRETLVHLFEREKRNIENLVEINILSGLSFDQHKWRCRVHFITCAGIGYTRVNADRFDIHLDCMRKHLALAMQFLDPIETNTSNQQQKFYEFAKTITSINSSDLNLDEYDDGLRNIVRSVDDDAYEMVLFVISLLHITASKYDVKDITRKICKAYHSQVDVDAQMANKCFTTQMHQLQCVPGLSSLLSLLFSIIIILVGSDGTLGKSAAPQRIIASSKSVSVFLSWLTQNKQFWCYAFFDKSLWNALETNLNAYLDAFPHQNSSEGTVNILFEDEDTLGFLPLIADNRVLREGDPSQLDLSAVLERLNRCRKFAVELTRLPIQLGSIDDSSAVYFLTSKEPTAYRLNDDVLHKVLRVTEELDVMRRFNLIGSSLVDKGEISDATSALVKQANELFPSFYQPQNETKNAEKGSTSSDDDENDENDEDSVESRENLHTQNEQLRLTGTKGILRVARDTVENKTKNKSSAKKHTSKTAPKMSPGRSDKKVLPLVVIDAANVAMKHGLNEKFSSKGIVKVFEFFQNAGYKAIGFIPQYYMDFSRTAGLRRAAQLNIVEVRSASIPDDIPLLQHLVSSGLIISTPPQDYDDTYIIKYAQRHEGYIISNDMYRDHIDRIDDDKLKRTTKKWIRSHTISYTFIGDEFLPNPDCGFFSEVYN